MSVCSITLKGYIPGDKTRKYYGTWYAVLGWAAAAWWHQGYTDIPQLYEDVVGRSQLPHYTHEYDNVWHVGLLWWRLSASHSTEFISGILNYMGLWNLTHIPMAVYVGNTLNQALSESARVSDVELPVDIFNEFSMSPYTIGKMSMLSRKSRQMITTHKHYKHFSDWKRVIQYSFEPTMTAKALYDMGLFTSSNIKQYCRFKNKFEFSGMLSTCYVMIKDTAVAITEAYHDRAGESHILMSYFAAHALQQRHDLLELIEKSGYSYYYMLEAALKECLPHTAAVIVPLMPSRDKLLSLVRKYGAEAYKCTSMHGILEERDGMVVLKSTM